MQEIPSEILSRAAGGDLDAFERIYKLLSGFVYSVALRYIRNTADAEEVTQDVFLKIHSHLGSFRSQSSFKTWVYKITMNTAINYGKKRARENSRRGDYDTAIETQEVPAEIETRLNREESERAVQDLLARLSPDQRACILLREVEELDYRQIADTLRININTVRSRLKRARESLLTLVKKGVVQHAM